MIFGMNILVKLILLLLNIGQVLEANTCCTKVLWTLEYKLRNLPPLAWTKEWIRYEADHIPLSYINLLVVYMYIPNFLKMLTKLIKEGEKSWSKFQSATWTTNFSQYNSQNELFPASLIGALKCMSGGSKNNAVYYLFLTQFRQWWALY